MYTNHHRIPYFDATRGAEIVKGGGTDVRELCSIFSACDGTTPRGHLEMPSAPALNSYGVCSVRPMVSLALTPFTPELCFYTKYCPIEML